MRTYTLCSDIRFLEQFRATTTTTTMIGLARKASASFTSGFVLWPLHRLLASNLKLSGCSKHQQRRNASGRPVGDHFCPSCHEQVIQIGTAAVAHHQAKSGRANKFQRSRRVRRVGSVRAEGERERERGGCCTTVASCVRQEQEFAVLQLKPTDDVGRSLSFGFVK
jgi:hypothetical protein